MSMAKPYSVAGPLGSSKNIVNFAPIMKDWKSLYRKFREWQKKPYQVAELSDEEHVCTTCATKYRGNYCPRCGQSCRIGRYSFKNAILLLLDVWSFGNRSFFRTLRDLILRPGYMIRDYLLGMQMAYFPPFKLLFTLVAVSLLVTHGWNIKGQDRLSQQKKEFTLIINEEPIVDVSAIDKNSEKTDTIQMQKTQREKQEFIAAMDRYMTQFMDGYERYMNFYLLFFLIIASGYYYLFFKKSPAIPDLRYSELLVALVYISNMLILYSIVCDFFCLSTKVELCSECLGLVPLKQLSGFSWGRTLLYSFLAILLMFVSLVVVSVVIALLVAAMQ